MHPGGKTSTLSLGHPHPGQSLPVPCPRPSLLPHCSPPPQDYLCPGPHLPGCLLGPCMAGLDYWWGCHHQTSYLRFWDMGPERGEWEQFQSNLSIPMQHFLPFRCTFTHIISLEPCTPFVWMQELRLKEVKSITSQSTEEPGLELLALCAGLLPCSHILHSETDVFRRICLSMEHVSLLIPQNRSRLSQNSHPISF